MQFRARGRGAAQFLGILIIVSAALAGCGGASGDSGSNRSSGTMTSTPTATNLSIGTGLIKWHPGQYMLSSVGTQIGNSNLSTKRTEQGIVRAGPSQVLGWEGIYYWPVFENATQGSYDFSVLDTDYTAITGYASGASHASPRRMSIEIWQDYYFSNSGTVVTPAYILQSSTYGASPFGEYGFWTASGDGSPTGGQVVAIWRPAVMNRFIALIQALAAHVLPDGYTVDNSPYIESVQFPAETADLPSGSTDSTYSDSIYSTELQALDQAARAAFPHTNVVMRNNFFGNQIPTSQFELTLPSYAIASGGPDIFGYSSGQNVCNGICGLTWGQAAYIGLQPSSNGTAWISGGSNLIGTVPYIGTIQNTEMIAEDGGYYTPADLFKQANTTLNATHVAWQYVSGMPLSGYYSGDVTANWFGDAGNQASWNAGGDTVGGVLTTIVANTLSNTACPSSYTGGCDTQ